MTHHITKICVASLLLFSAAAHAQGTGLAKLVQSGVQGPIVVIDLVKFKPGGEAEYNQYDAIAEAKVKSLGGAVIFRGKSVEVAPLNSTDWDRVTFRKYPTPKAVIEMGSSPEYQGAFPHRIASVEKSFVYAFSGARPSLSKSATPTYDPMEVMPKPNSDSSVFMLNLLRFKPDGGRLMYFGQYGAKVGPMIGRLGGGSKYLLKGETAVIADEVIDRMILVEYLRPKDFQAMVSSDEYNAVSHFRTDAIELGWVFPFSYMETPRI